MHSLLQMSNHALLNSNDFPICSQLKCNISHLSRWNLSMEYISLKSIISRLARTDASEFLIFNIARHTHTCNALFSFHFNKFTHKYQIEKACILPFKVNSIEQRCMCSNVKTYLEWVHTLLTRNCANLKLHALECICASSVNVWCLINNSIFSVAKLDSCSSDYCFSFYIFSWCSFFDIPSFPSHFECERIAQEKRNIYLSLPSFFSLFR